MLSYYVHSEIFLACFKIIYSKAPKIYFLKSINFNAMNTGIMRFNRLLRPEEFHSRNAFLPCSQRGLSLIGGLRRAFSLVGGARATAEARRRWRATERECVAAAAVRGERAEGSEE